MDSGGDVERSRPSTLLLYALMLGFVFLLVEAFAFATGFFGNDLYDDRDAVLDRIDRESFEETRPRVDMLLGWSQPGPRVVRTTSCLGAEIERAVDASGAWTYTGYDEGDVRVVVTGDSYTFGDEGESDESYPARLAGLLGVSVANLGIGGYGPAQAVLRLEQKLERYPQARVAILGIMYENVHRMVNAYRPVLYNTNPYSFKPFMAGGQLRPLPEAAFADVDRFREYADRGFDDDFWARPRHRFPFSLSLARALTSNFFYLRKFQKLFRGLGAPEYFLTFRSDAIARELVGLLDRFAELAREHGLTPVAVFIPRNRLDTESVSGFLAENAGRLDPDLVVGDVGAADVDWDRFNLEDPERDNICHPSAYGYGAIAEYVAELLRAEGVWPERASAGGSAG